MKTRFMTKGICMCLTVVMMACNNEDIDNMMAGGEKLSLEIVDNGFVSGVPLSGRATEYNIQTGFRPGDIVGVFAVSNGKVTQNNMGMMLSPDAGKWVGELKKESDSNAKYFVYYPWQQNLEQAVNPTADTAEEFFKNVIDNWQLPEDQDTYQEYMSGNLMVGKAEMEGTATLKSTLSQQMGLVVVKFPFTKYNLTDINSKPLNDYIVQPEGIKFTGMQPCLTIDGSYHFLIKPGTSLNFEAEYKPEDGLKSFSISNLSLEKGKYKRYIVDEGTETVKKHTLKDGDFYMKNGHLIDGDTSLSDDQKKNCLGIVYWVGDVTAQDPTLKNDFPNCNHGLVCALKDGNPITWQLKSDTYNQTVQHWVSLNTYGYRSLIAGAGENENMNVMLGYNNTKLMKMFNADSENEHFKAEIAEDILKFNTTYCPAPEFTSRWYIPSIKEIYVMMNEDKPDIAAAFPWPSFKNGEMLGKKFTALGSAYANQFGFTPPDFGQRIQDYYYSCSEHNAYKVWGIGYERYTTSVGEVDKEYYFHTRYVLAF